MGGAGIDGLTITIRIVVRHRGYETRGLNKRPSLPCTSAWFNVPPQDRSRQAWFSGPVEHYLVTVEFHNYTLDTLVRPAARGRNSYCTVAATFSRSTISTVNKGTQVRHDPGHD